MLVITAKLQAKCPDLLLGTSHKKLVHQHD
jgi:hypothetical protein